jgi:hypothetical protein
MLERDPKRRRLTPLNAPFRSPLRRPSTPTTSTIPSTNPSTPSNLNPNRPSLTSSTTPNRPRPPRQFKSPIFNRNDDESLTPEIITLLQRKRDLEAEIKQEKKALETAELALQYEKQVLSPANETDPIGRR